MVLYFFSCSPEMPACFMSRATRLRLIRSPSSSRSRQILGAPETFRRARRISRIRLVSRSSATARGEGGRVAHAKYPERLTPSTRHITLIEWLAFSAATNP